MTDLNDKVTVIIRSVGERTEQLCRELILAQGIAPVNVIIVRKAPFSSAMRKSFEIGIERGLPWTLCVDADVLLRPGAIHQIVYLAEQQPDSVCELQGYILDKFFGGPRHGGGHLYRTSLLPLALIRIPAEGVNIRPESYMLELMGKEGYPRCPLPYLMGLHDFEQYYKDIFRKCLVHAHKHTIYTEIFLSIWRTQALADRDYWVALQGFAKGVEYMGDLFIDAQQDIYQDFFEGLQLSEKSPLPINEYAMSDIEAMIEQWVEPPIYQKRFPTKFGLVTLEQKSLSIKEKLIKNLRLLGPVKLIPYSVGGLMSAVGKNLQMWANQEQ